MHQAFQQLVGVMFGRGRQSASIDEDILSLTNNISAIESVQTFVTDIDRSELMSFLLAFDPEALRAAVIISGQNLSSELEGFVSEELVLVNGRMLNGSDAGSNNVLLGVDSALARRLYSTGWYFSKCSWLSFWRCFSDKRYSKWPYRI